MIRNRKTRDQAMWGRAWLLVLLSDRRQTEARWTIREIVECAACGYMAAPWPMSAITVKRHLRWLHRNGWIDR